MIDAGDPTCSKVTAALSDVQPNLFFACLRPSTTDLNIFTVNLTAFSLDAVDLLVWPSSLCPPKP